MIQRVKTCMIPYPYQTPTKVDTKISVVKVVLPPLAPVYVYIYIYTYVTLERGSRHNASNRFCAILHG